LRNTVVVDSQKEILPIVGRKDELMLKWL